MRSISVLALLLTCGSFGHVVTKLREDQRAGGQSPADKISEVGGRRRLQARQRFRLQGILFLSGGRGCCKREPGRRPYTRSTPSRILRRGSKNCRYMGRRVLPRD